MARLALVAIARFLFFYRFIFGGLGGLVSGFVACLAPPLVAVATPQSRQGIRNRESVSAKVIAFFLGDRCQDQAPCGHFDFHALRRLESRRFQPLSGNSHRRKLGQFKLTPPSRGQGVTVVTERLPNGHETIGKRFGAL
jgi:hypothetical protein